MQNKRIGQLLVATTNRLKRIVNKKLREFGVSGVQSRALIFIYKNQDVKDVYQKDIECFLSIRSSTATDLVKCLIDLGLLERKRSEIDKRKKKLNLTSQGEKIAKETLEIFLSIENELINKISEESYNQFIKLIMTFEEILDLKEKVN